MKVCLGCSKNLESSEFYSYNKSKDGLRARCKECFKKQTNSWKKNNKLRKAESDKLWKANNRDKVSEYQRKYRSSGKGKIKEKEYSKIRYFLHSTKIKQKEARRRAAKNQRVPQWLSDQQKTEIENFYWLASDLKAITGEDYHVDHIVPLQGETVSGLHVPWNLQILPGDLNASKKNFFNDWAD